MSTATLTEHDARTAGITYFDPDDYLINIVRRATANRQDLLIAAEGLGELSVLSGRGEYFSEVGDMAAFCTLPADRFQVRVMEAKDSHYLYGGMVGRNLDELMWQAGFHASGGRMMQGCYRDDVVELVQWPNLTRLPATPNSARIAAFLTRYPTSITLAQRLLKLEREELFQFYSAARCASLARAVNRKPEEPRLEPHRNQTLLSALLGKIAGL